LDESRQVSVHPQLSADAQAAARMWEEIVRIEEEKQAAVGDAERAFQNGEPQWLERLARSDE
jgi:hypothetical protein